MPTKMASRFLKLEKSEESFKLPSFLSHSKKDQHKNSSHEKADSNSCNITEVLQTRIFHLLKDHPKGIQIERFNKAYQIKYSEDLTPSDYGFEDLVDLLQSFSKILSITEKSYDYESVEYIEIMLYAKNLSEDNDLLQEKDLNYLENENLNLEIKQKEKKSETSNLKKKKVLSSEKLPASAKLPSKVLNVFNAILSSNNGGIDIDYVSEEYKNYTGEELEPSCWGFNSILDMLSNLSDIFTICELTNGVFILCFASKKEEITNHNEIIKNSNKDSLCGPSLSDKDEDAVRFNRKLPLEVQKRLKSLFDDFPNGLEISEIIGAYRGLFGATLDELNPLEYGYFTLEAFLQAHHNLLTVKHYDKNIMVFPAGYWKDVTSLIEFPLPACCAVSSNESYTTYDNCSIFMKNTVVDFVIGEVRSPSKFHVMQQGEKSSQTLDALMDQMYEFYNRPISKRYEVKKESLLVRAPVVALYSEDMNWYRAIIININKIYVTKLFLVDYGTTCSCSYTDLRLLHQNFFKLPAQAISASLYGIRPSKGTNLWTKSTSKIFRSLVQNKYFHCRVHEVSESLIISLWDDNNTNINELLVTKGFASYEDGYFPINIGSSVEKLTPIYSLEKNIGINEIKISTQYEVTKEISNFNIEKHQEKNGYQLNLVSELISSDIYTNDVEISEDKVIKWLKRIDINENNTVVNSENTLKPHLPQEQINQNLINNFSPVTVQENISTINAEVKHHNDCADAELLHYRNRNNSQHRVILADSDQSINEFYKKRKVELLQISSDKKIHIVYLSGEPYMLSSEISRLMWGSDELHHQLKRIEIDVPYVVITSASHADIFTQLSSYGVKDVLDANNEFRLNVTVYPLEAALKILTIFKYNDVATMAIIKSLVWDNRISNTMF